jgi:CheY-like chemotaxis protein
LIQYDAVAPAILKQPLRQFAEHREVVRIEGFPAMDHYASPDHPRILVVEDEPLLRMFNTEMLSDAGFDVVEACNADEALEVLERIGDIQVVFTDVEMPGLIDGFALAERIAALWPTIKVVVTSGRRLPNATFRAPARCFIPKPYAVAEVLGLIDAFVHPRH